MRQLSLVINQSCSNRLRVQIISQLNNMVGIYYYYIIIPLELFRSLWKAFAKPSRSAPSKWKIGWGCVTMRQYLALCADKYPVHTEETVIASQGEVQEIPSLRDFLHHGTEGSPPVGRHRAQLHTKNHRGTG
jgi:hypothetical protein